MINRRIALLMAYDGHCFSGWQVQKNQNSIQDSIESALLKLHGSFVRLTGSGRTDRGVHALGQVAHFDTNSNIPADKYSIALNSILPKGIRILQSREVASHFHARYDAVIREYEYWMYSGHQNPFLDTSAWYLRHLPDLISLNRFASVLTGTHDFSTFAASGDQSNSKIRSIYTSAFYMKNGFLVFRISGNAFLWRMIRSITGTILDDALSGVSVSFFKDRLLARDRKRAGATAPAAGLYLRRVGYGTRIF